MSGKVQFGIIMENRWKIPDFIADVHGVCLFINFILTIIATQIWHKPSKEYNES